MKNLLQSKFMPLVMAGLGIVGFVLRKGLYAVALDSKNLLLEGHPLQWLLFLVTAVAAALAIYYAAENKQDSLCRNNLPAALGCILLAVGILVSLLPEGFSLSQISRIRNILGILTAAALVVSAGQLLAKRPVFFLLSCVGCIFFAVHMISSYRSWSSNPQIQDYLYTLFASVGLMIFAYQLTSRIADCGNEKILRAAGAVTIFCSITALSGTEYPVLYLTGCIWVFTNLLCPQEPVPAVAAQERE